VIYVLGDLAQLLTTTITSNHHQNINECYPDKLPGGVDRKEESADHRNLGRADLRACLPTADLQAPEESDPAVLIAICSKYRDSPKLFYRKYTNNSASELFVALHSPPLKGMTVAVRLVRPLDPFGSYAV